MKILITSQRHPGTVMLAQSTPLQICEQICEVFTVDMQWKKRQLNFEQSFKEEAAFL